MDILSFLKNNIVILDGSMGTMLQSKGLKPGEFPEEWNLSHPDIICDIHKAYFDAGSNVVCTNTFGANILKFPEEKLEKIIEAAMKNARRAAELSKGRQNKFVALDVGPSGKLLKPYGDFDFEEAVSLFANTIKLGAKYGADLVFIETMNDSYETKAALLAAKENCNLPVFVSNAYGADGKLMTGASPEAMVCMLEAMGANAVGANCSLGPKALSEVILKMLKCASVPVIIKPNAGLPKNENGKTRYDVLPEEFAEEVKKLAESGARVLGGCCGTTPEYIEALSKAVSGVKAKEITEKNLTWASSYTHTVSFDKKPVLIGERINPTGKKRFKEALLENDIGYILREGINQQEKGAHILDVNVGMPGIDEKEMLTRAVCEIQPVINLPLQIDTSDVDAMESALRRYNGKAMINSVNGKKESMDKVFPLVKKYGGLVVALTLDENGIPNSVSGRVKIAEKILCEAKKYGIYPKDIIFDTLAMAVSADAKAAETTLNSLEIIKNKMGCHTSLGVSNISFGLPERDSINSTFFAMALQKGLSGAIMNPYSDSMLKTYHSYCALAGLDENFAEYIEFSDSFGEKGNDSISKDVPQDLENCIIKGLKENAAAETARLLTSMDAMDIVANKIVPALDKVGVSYEQKKLYLPQLLMSAEAAKWAFEEIKNSMSAENSSAEKGPVVLATVKGDIHDIGKNIVKLLMENYGYKVIDLGKDVPPETIVSEAVKSNAAIVGLSALMTTTVPAMEETIKLMKEKKPDCPVVVGGAVLTEEYASAIGADKYAADAMEMVRFAEKLKKS